jgi:hypothetical protein
VAGVPTDYNVATDDSGFFTATVGLANGVYNWSIKGQTNLATAGILTLAGGSASVEMGLMRAGDCNNSNSVTATDFTLLKAAFGKTLGEPGYDSRADFNRDNVVSSPDFTLLKSNFGQAGATLTCP